MQIKKANKSWFAVLGSSIFILVILYSKNTFSSQDQKIRAPKPKATPLNNSSKKTSFSDKLFDLSKYNPLESFARNIDKALKLATCNPFPKELIKTGFVVSGCTGRLGNQLGVLSLGMAMYLKFGIQLALKHDQYKILDVVFDMKKTCAKDGTTFCTELPRDCKYRRNVRFYIPK